MTELNRNVNVNFKKLYIPLTMKLKEFKFIRSYLNKIVNQTIKKVIFHVFDPNYNVIYYYVCEWSKNGLNVIKTDFNTEYPWIDTFNNLKRVNDITRREGCFIFFYNGRKEICGIAEKVLNKDNIGVVEAYKYYLIMC
jgi:hypothetical protein